MNRERATSISIFSACFVCFLLLASANADPHFVQALDPYMGNKEVYSKYYLVKFSQEVDYDVRSTVDEDGETVYIYEYSVAIRSADSFSLDISCPGAPPYSIYGFMENTKIDGIASITGIASDPLADNPEAMVTDNGNLVWQLRKHWGRQAMWFYSWQPPVKRVYHVTTDERELTGAVDGPGCSN